MKHKKIKIFVIAFLLLCTVFPAVTWAATPGEDSGDKGADWAERLSASLIAAPAKWILNKVGLYDPLELVYGDFVKDAGESFEKVDSRPYFSTFTKSEWSALQEFYEKVNQIVPIELVLVVIFMGISYWYASTRPDSRVSFRGYVAGLLLAMLLLRMGGLMFAFLFDLNELLVAQFYGVVDGKIKEGASFLTAFISLEQDGYIGSALLFIVGIFSVSIINWQYAIRKVMIALLIGLLPVVAVISILNREALVLWFRELVANIFLQASHAAVLSFLIVLGNATGGHHGGTFTTSQFWFTLVALLSIPSISTLVRKLLGAEGMGTGVGGALATGAGLGSLMAVGKMLGGGKKAGSGSQSDGQLGSVSETSSGRTSSSPRNIPANIAVKGGKTLATAGGAFAGGLVGGPGGMAVGAGLASQGAGLFADTGSSLAQFASKTKSDGAMNALGLSDRKQLLDPDSMYDAGKRCLAIM